MRIRQTENKIKWNDKDPIGLTIKPTIYLDEYNNNLGNDKNEFQNINKKNTLHQSDIDISFGNNIDFYDKIKTINEEDEDNFAILIKSSKTLLEYAYKKVDISEKNNEAIQQILKEIEMIKKLDHPNIIKLYEANISKDNKYIEVLAELPEDGDLQMKLDEYECDYIRFQENQLLDWLNQICLALKSLHSEKILHRNIKPSSISLMKRGYAKLGDFGFAKIASKGRDLRRVKTFMNKIKFIAPEIFEQKDFTEKTDIWFLGVTFFQLMTFKFPFKGENDDEKMESILNEYKNDYNYSYSDNFKELINKMISKNPDKRPTPDDILDMPFIRKRMECYVDENENLFLKSKKSLDIFNNIEEIKTVESFGENQKENKKEIRIIDNLEAKDSKEEKSENIIKINSKSVLSVKEEEKDIKENNNNKVDKKDKTKEKKVKFNLNEEEINKKKKENANKKAKNAAYEFVKHLLIIKNLIKK